MYVQAFRIKKLSAENTIVSEAGLNPIVFSKTMLQVT